MVRQYLKRETRRQSVPQRIGPETAHPRVRAAEGSKSSGAIADLSRGRPVLIKSRGRAGRGHIPESEHPLTSAEEVRLTETVRSRYQEKGG